MKLSRTTARWLAPLVGVGLGALTVACPRPALALDGGSSSLGLSLSGAVYRYYPDGHTAYNFRAANLNPQDINFQDCSDDIILQFSLSVTGLPTTDTLEVWAGSTDCSQTTARQTGSGPYCWQVAPRGAFANANPTTGQIHVRNLTQYVDDTTVGHFAPVTSVPGPAACHTQTTSGAVALSLYFMFIRNDGITADAVLSYGQNIDMVGPLPPTLNLPIGIGDGLLLINWTTQIDSTIQGFQIYAQDQGPSGLGLGAEAGAAIQTTPIYCRSGAGVTTCPDAGNTADGAVADAKVVDAQCTTTYPDGASYVEMPDAAGYASMTDAELAASGCERGSPVNTITTQQLGGGTCSSNVLVDLFSTSVTNTSTFDSGVADGATTIATATDGGAVGGSVGVGISEIDASAYGVGNVGGNTTSSYTITSVRYPDGGTGPLINGHQYAVAVAAYDDDGNVGIVSNLGCQTPAPVTDFWDKYKEDGGLAGGGFCALEAPGAPVAGSVFGIGAGTALVAYGRRRRRRNS